MTEPLICETCGHDDEAHCPDTGLCLAKDCRCVCFRLNDFEDDEDDGFDDNEPLDFEHGQ